MSLEDIVREQAEQIYDRTREAMSAQWDAMTETDRRAIRCCAERVLALELRELAGDGVTEEERALVDATVANWLATTSIRSALVARAFGRACLETATRMGTALIRVGGRILTGI